MLAVACVGMLVYSVAGAASDGKELAPAKSSTTSKCEPTTSTTQKGGDKGSTTSTTEKGGDKGSTTSTTEKGGDKASTTSTTEKSGDKGSTTTTTEKSGDAGAKSDSGDPTVEKAAAPSTALEAKGDSATATKDSDGDTASKAATDDKDGCSTTTTTEKGGKDGSGGKDSTTTTTRKSGGKGSTTTTTDKDGKSGGKGSTTSTTAQGGTVEPQTPGDPGPDDSTDPGSSADPGDTPISPQEAPPYDAPDSDPGPAADPEAAADPGPVESFDMWDDEADVAVDPLEAPGSGSMLPVFNNFLPSSDEEAAVARSSRSRSRSSGDVQQLAAAPVVASRISAPAVTESAAVSRQLAGVRTSVTESAFPASIISTPSQFPVNHRDPLTAAALVILVGVSRELFKVWRRRATEYWPA
jgi:hypothetical protein